MNILYVYADTPKEWNCSEFNCIIPAKAANRVSGHNAETIFLNEWVANQENSQKLSAKADIIIVERNFFGDALTVMQLWKARNKTIIAIFDDAYNHMHPENLAYDFWSKGMLKGKNQEGQDIVGYMKPPPLEQFRWGLQLSKAVQVPSVGLAEEWGKYAPTHYVRNYLDWKKYVNVGSLFPHNIDDEIVIGWCGSMSHWNSFNASGVVRAVEEIAKKHPKVKVLIGGDQRVFDLIKVDNKIFQPYVPANQWTPLLKSIDIGLAPLEGEYDKRRSWLKALEYTALKIPWIGTNYRTYSELSDFGTLIENDTENWFNSMDEMIINYSHYKQMANTKGYEFAKSQSSDNNISKTLALYEEIINKPWPELVYNPGE